MPIKLLPDGTPEERARMAKSAALAERVETLILASKVTEGTVIEALAMLVVGRVADQDGALKWATALSVAIGAVQKLKEKADGRRT